MKHSAFPRELTYTIEVLELAEVQSDLLAMLSSQRDVYITRTTLDAHASMREAIALHALNHITKSVEQVPCATEV